MRQVTALFQQLGNLLHGAALGGRIGRGGGGFGLGHGLVHAHSLAGPHGDHLAVFHHQFHARARSGADGFALLDDVARLQGAGGTVGKDDDRVTGDRQYGGLGHGDTPS